MTTKQHNVLFCFHNCDYYSGATRSLIDLLDRIIEEPDILIVAAFPQEEGTAIEYLKKKNVITIVIKSHALVQDEKQHLIKRMIKFPAFFYWYLQTYISIKKLQSIIAEYSINAIYTNTSVNIIGALVQKYYNIPNIWHFREYRHEDHGIHFFLGDKYLIKLANNYSKRMLFISQSMYDYHKNLGCDTSKMTMIYNDISPRYIIKRNWVIDSKPLNLLVAGDVKEGKGQLDVVKAVKILKQNRISVHLFIAGKFGGNEYSQKIFDYIHDNELEDNVEILGLVQDMNKLRLKCEIGVVSSIKEAFGRVTVEGMLAGLTMIGSNTGGTIEIIQNGKNGFIYESGNYTELANIISYLHSNRNVLNVIGENGQLSAIEKYASGKCLETVLRYIRSGGE